MSDGTIEKHDSDYIFRFERDFPEQIERVWQAITLPEEIEGWIGARPELDLVPGGRYVTHHGNGMTVVDRVEQVDPPRLFQHTFWQEVNPSALVTWELRPIDAGCHLTLAHRMSQSDIEQAAKLVASGDSVVVILSRNAAGWHQLLDKLDARLTGRARVWSDEQRQCLIERYAAMAT
jgi:uncharacterized protein YndB with AHSA1/START domain